MSDAGYMWAGNEAEDAMIALIDAKDALRRAEAKRSASAAKSAEKPRRRRLATKTARAA